MKKIEEIIEMMREINPDIKMDDVFKKSLKNKLEITSFAKLKNTKNKKTNIAKKGIFSFRKTNNNIFEKPKFNFIKLLSPIFIGAFAVFGFVNFYGNDLFQFNKFKYNNNFNYETERIEEVKKIEIVNKKSPIIPFYKEDKQVSSYNNIINEKIKIKQIKEVKKIEKTKIIKKRELPKIESVEETIIQEDKKIRKNVILKDKKLNKKNSINTEIIDLLGDGKENFNSNFDSVSKKNNLAPETSFDKTSDASVFEVVPEIENINNFIKFCEDKKGIIKDDICEYENKKCSRKDFENKKCDEK